MPKFGFTPFAPKIKRCGALLVVFLTSANLYRVRYFDFSLSGTIEQEAPSKDNYLDHESAEKHTPYNQTTIMSVFLIFQLPSA